MPEDDPADVRNEVIQRLAVDVLTYDSARVAAMVDLLRLTIVNTKAPLNEVLWAMISILVAIVRTEKAPEGRKAILETVQNMLSLSMGLGEKLDADNRNDQIH